MMVRALETPPSETPSQPRSSDGRYSWVCITCWIAAVALGAAHAWVARFTMYPDGVSYLDMGDRLWRGDWHNVVNAYWSPLYPAIAGMFLKIFKPAIEHEYPLVHLVNFLIHLAALVCFEFFFSAFIAEERDKDADSTMPFWAWYVVGYSAFICSSFLLISLSFVSGDMAIAAVVYLACGMLLRIRTGNVGWRTFACLGVALGFGYLSKAVMFLMSVPFFVVAALIQRKLGKSLRLVALSIFIFALIASPWVFMLSKQKGRPTFGDTGKINYAINVSGANFFIPNGETTRHPVHQIAGVMAYEYAQPISGTYPLWYDPSFWHEGIATRFNLKKQLLSILTSLLAVGWISFNLQLGLNLSIAIIFLYLTSSSISGCVSRAGRNWMLWVPALSGIALYSLVVIEPRYVGALFCVLWIVAFSGINIRSSSRRLVTATVFLVALTTCVVQFWQISRTLDSSYFAGKHVASPVSVDVALALRSKGFEAGDKVGVVGNWLFPSQEASYVARLSRLQIIGEARPDDYWSFATRGRIEAEFARAGAKAILTNKPDNEKSCVELAAAYYLCPIGEKLDSKNR